MKRKVLLVAAIVTGSFAFAQEGSSFKDQNGQEVLPQAGDMSIGFSVGAFPTFGGGATNTIMVKKFKDSSTAYRGSLTLGGKSETTSTPAAGTAVDERTISTTGFGIGAGLEKRKGSGRVQAVYGAQASFALTSKTTENTYGSAGAAITSDKEVEGSKLNFGLNGFLGAEYFFAPKFSIGAEYTLGFNMASQGDREFTQSGTGAVTTPAVKNGSDVSWGISSVAANINFYF